MISELCATALTAAEAKEQAAEVFRQLQSAYTVLRDPKQRALYAQRGASYEQGQEAG